MNSKHILIGLAVLVAQLAIAQSDSPPPSDSRTVRQSDSQTVQAPGTNATPAEAQAPDGFTPIEPPSVAPTEPSSVLGPPPSGPMSPAVGASAGVPLAGTSQLGGAAPTATAKQPVGGILHWGILELRPHLSYSATYGNNLQSFAGNQANTWVHQLSPGMLMVMGPHVSLDYTPTLRWYSDKRFSDGVDHSVSLNTHVSYGEWRLGLSQGYSVSSQPLVETGMQTDQETWSTALTASRPLTTKLSLDLGANQSFRFMKGQVVQSEQLSDMREWSTMNWLNYQFKETLDFGLGAGFTYDDVQVGSDMTSEQVQARARWRPGQKLTVTASGGLDIRQFLDSNASDMVSPIFSVMANYRLFEQTSIFVSANRGVAPSYFSNAVSESSGVSAGFQQRLLGRLMFSASGSYGTTSYTGTANNRSGLAAGLSSYDSTSVSLSLGTQFLKRGSISIFYSKTWNQSNSALYNFDPQTTGVQVAYAF